MSVSEPVNSTNQNGGHESFTMSRSNHFNHEAVEFQGGDGFGYFPGVLGGEDVCIYTSTTFVVSLCVTRFHNI